MSDPKAPLTDQELATAKARSKELHRRIAEESLAKATEMAKDFRKAEKEKK